MIYNGAQEIWLFFISKNTDYRNMHSTVEIYLDNLTSPLKPYITNLVGRHCVYYQ